MKLHGQISIDLPAGDYFALADHRKRLEEILAFIRSTWAGSLEVPSTFTSLKKRHCADRPRLPKPPVTRMLLGVV